MVADPRFQPRPGRTDDPHNALTLAERDRRWEATRAEMDKRGIDCLFIVSRGMNDNGNCRWLDNNDYSERQLIFPRKGSPVLFFQLANWGKWYMENGWEGVDFRASHGNIAGTAAEVITDLGYHKGTIGLVGLSMAAMRPEGSFPWLTYKKLRTFLPEAQIRDASDLLIKLRMYKSAEEIAMIEKASEIANVEIDAVLRNVRPGMRENELVAEAAYAALKAGNELGRDFWTILCSGKDGYPVNRRPTDRIIRSGEVLHLGHYTRFGGYWSHPHTAISLGKLDPEYAPLRDAVRAATDRAMELLKPGAHWKDIDEKIDQPVLDRGYYHEIPQLHCVGLDGVEPPSGRPTRGNVRSNAPWRRKPAANPPLEDEEWKSLSVGRGDPDDVVVQPGLAVAIEVKAALDDRIYVEFGPQIIVEKDGPRVLTPMAMDLIEL
ncbi:MAG: M24 family metallopeptidase [Rhodospirillaceae bacterium]